MQWDQLVATVSMNVIPSVDLTEVLIDLHVKYKNVKSEKMSFALFEASATDNKMQAAGPENFKQSRKKHSCCRK